MLLAISDPGTGEVRGPHSPQVWTNMAACFSSSRRALCPGTSEEIGMGGVSLPVLLVYQSNWGWDTGIVSVHFVLLFTKKNTWFSCVGIRLLPTSYFCEAKHLNVSTKSIFTISLFWWQCGGGLEIPKELLMVTVIRPTREEIIFCFYPLLAAKYLRGKETVNYESTYNCC